MQFDPEFKKVLSEIPSKEKDKLVIRLLRKDTVLAKQLYFQLLDLDTVDEKRAKMAQRIRQQVTLMTKEFYNPGLLLVDLRNLSGEITLHLKTTKDKIGEPGLNLLMLIQALTNNNRQITAQTRQKTYTFCKYVIVRAFKILLLIDKMDDDYFMDFKDDLIRLGELISENDHLMRVAITNGLDINWLIRAEIPQNIQEIHKDLRERGYV